MRPLMVIVMNALDAPPLASLTPIRQSLEIIKRHRVDPLWTVVQDVSSIYRQLKCALRQATPVTLIIFMLRPSALLEVNVAEQ